MITQLTSDSESVISDATGLATTAAVGRQIIADEQGAVMGYELLYRKIDGTGPGHSALSGREMTAAVVYNSVNIGVNRIVGDKLLFCNADREVLLHPDDLVLSPQNTVLEILETVAVDAEVFAGCVTLRHRGYRLALDDFIWFEGAEEILGLVSYVKIDVLALDRAEVAELARKCRQYEVRLIAEKIEDPADFAWLRELGFELFQGYAVERPVLVTGPMLPATAAGRVNLAMSLFRQDLDVGRLETILRTEPGLTHQILSMAAVGRLGETKRRIGSIHQALVLLGPTRIQGWVALLLVHSAGPQTYDGLQTALTRARACEILAGIGGRISPAVAFMAGMVSAFDILIATPACDLAQSLPLSDELLEAAFGYTSPVAQIVRDAIDYQAGAARPKLLSGIPRVQFDNAFADAFAWSLDHSAGVDGS